MMSFLTDRENVMVFSHRTGTQVERAVVRMRIEGAREPTSFEGVQKLESASSYFRGNDPQKWVKQAPHYRKVRARDIYDGIDLVYYGDGRKIEYDFVVAPGADPRQIELTYEGANSLSRDEHGNLAIATKLGTLIQRAPVVYQEIAGQRRPVKSAYRIREGRVSFELAAWDRKRELVIDPVLEYSTFLGGANDDVAYSVAVDSAGSTYVTGNTFSTDFPTSGGGYDIVANPGSDVFVTKLSPDGDSLVYSTYIGGSLADEGTDIAVPSDGNAYVVGTTYSNDFPMVNAYSTGFQGDTQAFVLILDPTGTNLSYSTFLGGSGSERGTAIFVHPSGAFTVAGWSNSNGFPTVPGSYQTKFGGGSADAFVTQFNATGSSLNFSTWLGGRGEDQGFGLAADFEGDIYLTGHTDSFDFPTTGTAFSRTINGSKDVFVAEFNPTGTALLFSTLLGGSGADSGKSIAVDITGASYVTGTTESVDFPVVSPIQPSFGGGIQDAFLTKLSPSGTALVYSTYYGQQGEDAGTDVAVDPSRAAYVTGYVNAFCLAAPTGQDAMLAKFDPSGSALTELVLLGGNATDRGQSVVLDASGAAYVTGGTASGDFVTSATAFQKTLAGGSDAFVRKITLPLTVSSVVASPTSTPQSASILTAFPNALRAQVRDNLGIPKAGVTVTFNAPGSGASATLSSTSEITGCDGTVSVNATANTTTGTYTITATVPNVAQPANFVLTNTPSAGSAVSFTQQPQSTTAGSVMAPVLVRMEDAQQNPIAGENISMIVAGGTAALGGTLTRVTNAIGIANFNDLTVAEAGTYQLEASAAGLTALSTGFVITPGSPASVTIQSGNGQSAAAGKPFSSPLQVLVKDAQSNPVPDAFVTFTAPGSGPTVTFGGPATVTTDNAGIATSPTMTAGSQTGSFQVTASASGAAAPASFNLTILPGTANSLAFLQQPSDTAAGSQITPAVTVQVQDSAGARVGVAGTPVSLQLITGNLAGATTQNTDANGIATFSDLSVAQAGTYQLGASSTGIASILSTPFGVTAGPPATITASGGTPQSAVTSTAYGTPLQITLTDAAGNPVSGATITFEAPLTGPSGTFGGQTTIATTTDAVGHASAVITANNVAGSFGATAYLPSVTGAAFFDLTNLAPTPNTLTFVQQPSDTPAGQVLTPVQVKVGSLAARGVSASGVPIIISLPAGTGTLSGTVVRVANPNGIATFDDLSINDDGVKRLRAVAAESAPADSNVFQITPGPAATITAYSGSFQETTVLQPFPAPLWAQVKDASGNFVNGAQVTFAVPASGPSGTFNGSPVVTTGTDGIAKAPPLTANNQAGSFSVTATTLGIPPATFTLTNLAAPPSSPEGGVSVAPRLFRFVSELGQPAPASQLLYITSNGTTSVGWAASALTPFVRLSPSAGVTPGVVSVAVEPGSLGVGQHSGLISVTPASGVETLVPVSYIITSKPALVVAPASVVFTAANNQTVPPPQTVLATSSSRNFAYTAAVKVSTPPQGTWLQVTPTTGQTPATLVLSVNPAGLTEGVYNGAVELTPMEPGLSPNTIPVTLVVGCGQGGCETQPKIDVVVNSASFQPGGAPGALLSIFGSDLADGTYQSQQYPLPTKLGRTTVTANGQLVPLLYASPTLINFQMPSSAPPLVEIVVHNGAEISQRTLRASSGYVMQLAPVDPGLFINGDRAAALNGDLTVHTPATPIPAGGFVILYITGQGSVTPPVPDGTGAPSSPLSIIDAAVRVTIGGLDAKVDFKGLAPTLAGTGQINAAVPAGLTPGNHPVFVTVGGLPSNTGLITVK